MLLPLVRSDHGMHGQGEIVKERTSRVLFFVSMCGYAYGMARLCDGVEDAWEGPSFL